METTAFNATEYRNVSLALLSESKTNPRRVFDDAALKELTQSICTQGVLSPLLVKAARGERLRDRRRSAAVSCRADGRG